MKNPRYLVFGTLALLLALSVGAWLFGYWEKPAPPPPPLVLPSDTPPTPLNLASSTPPAVATATPEAAPNPSEPSATPPPPDSLATESERKAAEAAQAAQIVAARATTKAITNNLRQLASAAQQYMLDKGVTQASYQDIVGTNTDSYIRSVTPVADENYQDMVIGQTTTQVSISTSDGLTTIYNL